MCIWVFFVPHAYQSYPDNKTELPNSLRLGSLLMTELMQEYSYRRGAF